MLFETETSCSAVFHVCFCLLCRTKYRSAPYSYAPNTGAPYTNVPATPTPPTTAPSTPFPDTNAPLTPFPNTDAPPTPFPDTDAPPTPFPDTDAPPTPFPDTDAPPTPFPDTDAPPTPFPDTDVPPTPFPDTDVPPTPFPDTDAPPTPFPDTDVPPTPFPDTDAPPTPFPDTDVPPTPFPDTDVPPTPFPDTDAPPTPFLDTDTPTPFPDTDVPTPYPDTDAPPTPFPDTEAPSTSFPDTDALLTPLPDTNAPSTPFPGTDAPPFPDTEAPSTPFPGTGAPAFPDTDVPPTPFPDTDAPPAPDTYMPPTPFPDTDAPPDTNAPPTPFPGTDVPQTKSPDTDAQPPFPDTDTPPNVPNTDAPKTKAPATAAPSTVTPVTSFPETPTPDILTTVPKTQLLATEVPEAVIASSAIHEVTSLHSANAIVDGDSHSLFFTHGSEDVALVTATGVGVPMRASVTAAGMTMSRVRELLSSYFDISIQAVACTLGESSTIDVTLIPEFLSSNIPVTKAVEILQEVGRLRLDGLKGIGVSENVEVSCEHASVVVLVTSATKMLFQLTDFDGHAIRCPWFTAYIGQFGSDIFPQLDSLMEGDFLEISHSDWGLTNGFVYGFAIDGEMVKKSQHPNFSMGPLPSGESRVLQTGILTPKNRWVVETRHTCRVAVVSPKDAEGVLRHILTEVNKAGDEEVLLAVRVVENMSNAALLDGGSSITALLDTCSGLGDVAIKESRAPTLNAVVGLASNVVASLLPVIRKLSYTGTTFDLAIAPASEGKLNVNEISAVFPSDEGRVSIIERDWHLYNMPVDEAPLGNIIETLSESSKEQQVQISFSIDKKYTSPALCNIVLREWNDESKTWGAAVDLSWPASVLEEALRSDGSGACLRVGRLLESNESVTVKTDSRLGTVGVFISSEVMPSTNIRRLLGNSNFNSWRNIDSSNIATLTAVGFLYLLFYSLIFSAWWYDKQQDAKLHTTAPSQGIPHPLCPPERSCSAADRAERMFYLNNTLPIAVDEILAVLSSIVTPAEWEDLCSMYRVMFRQSLRGVLTRNIDTRALDVFKHRIPWDASVAFEECQSPIFSRYVRRLPVVQVAGDSVSLTDINNSALPEREATSDFTTPHSDLGLLAPASPVSVGLEKDAAPVEQRPRDLSTTDKPVRWKKLRTIFSNVLAAMSAHLWFSVLFRKPGQAFTRPQRIMVLFSAVNTVIFICAVFNGTGDANRTVTKTLLVAVLAACMMTPTTVLLGLLFKRAAYEVPVKWNLVGEDYFADNPVFGDLTVRVVSARGLPKNVRTFAEVENEGRVYRTGTAPGSMRPAYDASEAVVFRIRSEEESLNIRICEDIDCRGRVLHTASTTMQNIAKKVIRDDSSAVAALDRWLAADGGEVLIRVICEYVRFSSPQYRSQEHKEWWLAQNAEVAEGNETPLSPLSPNATYSPRRNAKPRPGFEVDAELEEPPSLCERAKKESGKSFRFMAFLVLLHFGCSLLMGWRDWWPLLTAVCLVLCIATYFLQFKRAAILLIISLGLYGCIYLAVNGYLAIGIAVGYLWFMIVVSLVTMVVRRSLLPLVLACFWSVHLLIVLFFYYDVFWWVAVVSCGGQLVVAFLCWYFIHLNGMSYVASYAYIGLWSSHLATCLQYHSALSDSEMKVQGTELWLAPLVFLLAGWLVILRTYQVQKGGILPQHLPYWVVYIAYALALCIQLGTCTVYLTEALHWEQKMQKNFFLTTVVALFQDLIFNEPVKVLVLTYADPIAKTLAKSTIGKVFSTFLTQTGLMTYVKAIL